MLYIAWWHFSTQGEQTNLAHHWVTFDRAQAYRSHPSILGQDIQESGYGMANHNRSGKSIASICLYYVLNIKFNLSGLFSSRTCEISRNPCWVFCTCSPWPLQSNCKVFHIVVDTFCIELPNSENQHPIMIQQAIYRMTFTPMGSGNYIHFTCYKSLL